jgi:hypothetical protein
LTKKVISLAHSENQNWVGTVRNFDFLMTFSDFDDISFKMQIISVAFRLGKVGFGEY